MYELWPPDSYPEITAPTPTVTGCTRNSTVSGLSTFTAENPAVAATTQRLIRPIFVKGQGGVLRWSVTVTNRTGNLLTANQASVETDTTGLDAIFGCSVARSTVQSKHGSACLEVTAAGGAWTAGQRQSSTSFHAPVQEGKTYTATLSSRAATAGRSVQVAIRWSNGANATLSIDTSAGETNSTSAWTTHTLTATAPAGATNATVYAIGSGSTGVGEVHYLDCLGLWVGTGGSWGLPGAVIGDAAGGSSMDVQAQVIFLDDDDAQVDRWTGPEWHIEAGIVLSARLAVPRLSTKAQLKVLSTCDTNAGQWTEYDSRLEQIPADDPYTPPGVDATFGDMSPEGVAPPAPPAGLPGFEANSPARRSPQVRWCQLHDSVRPDLTPKKNAREV